MSTIKDVARRTGLSLSTISKYLNGGNVREENRLAIDAAIEELDYSVNADDLQPVLRARRGGDGACAAPQRLRVLRLQLRF